MKIMMKYALLVMVSFFMVGCGFLKPVTITKTTYVPVTIKEEFTQLVTPTPPPVKEEDIAASPNERVVMLHTLAQGLYGDVAMCNNRLSKIESLNNEIFLFVKQKNDEVKK